MKSESLYPGQNGGRGDLDYPSGLFDKYYLQQTYFDRSDMVVAAGLTLTFADEYEDKKGNTYYIETVISYNAAAEIIKIIPTLRTTKPSYFP